MSALSRLDKILSESGAASRSEARTLIRSGRVTVNGLPARSGEEKYDPAAVEIAVDGKSVNTARYRYFLLHKPAGVLSATEDSRQETVLDLLPPDLRRLGLFPVGRLDKDVTGLLLLTNDGDLAHRVISPKYDVPKYYRARVEGTLTEADAAAFAAGVTLSDGTRCRPAELCVEAPDVGVAVVREGKYHQVKRMFAALGKPVLALHRFRVGNLRLDPSLAPGAFRELDPAELSEVLP